MKLYFLFSFNEDLMSFDCAEKADYNSVSSHPSQIHHEHENYTNFFSFMKYEIFSSEFTNGQDWELPLIDIPDEYVFQFMLMGLQDYDLIVFNYRTKRIMLGTFNSEIRYISSTLEPLCDAKDKMPIPRNRSFGSYYEDEDDYEPMLDFRTKNDKIKKREKYQVELDSENGYNEIREVLKPYYLDIANKMYMSMFMHMEIKEPIGIETREIVSYPKSSRVVGFGNGISTDKPKHRMKLDSDSFETLYKCWLEDDELFTENKKLMRIQNTHEKLLQVWYNDSYSAFTDSSTEYWKK